MSTVVVLPARYGSKRLAGKPLMKINGVSMLERVVRLADAAVTQTLGYSVLVATDDERIERHAAGIGARCVMT